ncbi:alpha/beta hydrolase [Acinetobacter pollinis]|uniref:alpha/beta hydrolase n=1 Tax=Acinetobacter pollinis TaxID=2605270 RepID=UPI0018A25256|nr:alpha/beta hydrolase [Acinetobacter pollinis]MBF7689182.1 alpha/beta hydrolase [Acinetobacter pollinis]MBF7691844.1 alpha/beta hydrolase [Acinetobacter pollinis]MBF7698310.1 alpha/beta hydrolase [Acinetobacter pollinis]MBF7699949.1 alpha/beta hydrolase [Acinetobacter pollinis]
MTDTIFLDGPIGKIEVFVDYPEGTAKGFAVVCHPHPLQGGTPHHKVPALMAQILKERGCVVYRPSFRGSGQSEGTHNEGFGETEDILSVIEYARQQYSNLRFFAGGFSFGAHVMAKAYHALELPLKPEQLILCGLPTATVQGLRHYKTPEISGDILLIHGEADEVTLLSDAIVWAKPQKHAITIFPGANHFFTGYLKQIRTAMQRYIQL